MESRSTSPHRIHILLVEKKNLFTYSCGSHMYSDTQSPSPSSREKDSANSVRMHSSPSPVSSDPIASGGVSNGTKSQTRSVAAILRDASSPFDRDFCIITPFDDEVRRDAEFYQS